MKPAEAILHAYRAAIESGNEELAIALALDFKARVKALGAATLQDAIRALIEEHPRQTLEEASEGLPPA